MVFQFTRDFNVCNKSIVKIEKEPEYFQKTTQNTIISYGNMGKRKNISRRSENCYRDVGGETSQLTTIRKLAEHTVTMFRQDYVELYRYVFTSGVGFS
jgi:hypothetical protein